MSARSALRISRFISQRLLRQRQADYRNVVAKQAKQRLTRNLLLESLEDRRVMDVGLSGNDEILISGSIVDSASNSQQLLDTAENIPEVRNWNWQTQAIADADRTQSVVQKQFVDQQLAQRLEDALSQSIVSASASIENPANQPVSLGTQRVSQAISQTLAATDWGAQLQTNSTPTISQLSQSLETGQQPTSPLQLTQQKVNSQSIAEAMMRVGSPSEMIGGQLFTGSDASGLANSIGQAESRIMVSGNQEQWSSQGTSQPASDTNDLGLTAQALTLSDQQVTQVIDGSIMAGLFGQSVDGSEAGATTPQAMMLAEGEGEPSSGGGSSQPPSIPFVLFPELRFTQSNTALDSFVPTDPSSFTDIHGTPGGWGLGSNWTHTVSVNWTSDQVWSYTETLTMNFLASETESDSGPLSELESEDPDDSDSSVDERLEVTGTWNSSVNTLRLGYVIMTFTASRGSSSATANSPLFNMGGGTRWSISLNFVDAVQTLANASANSTAQINPALVNSASGGEGEEGSSSSDPNQLPDDFTGDASWLTNFVSVQFVEGTLDISSIPFWISQGSSPETSIVDRLVTADGSSNLGTMFDLSENFSSSSQSGNIHILPEVEPPDTPTGPENSCPIGGHKDVDYEAELAISQNKHDLRAPSQVSSPSVPTNPSSTPPANAVSLGNAGWPLGAGVDCTGNGSASATSASRRAGGLGNQSGTWSLMGASREQQGSSRWMGLVGDLSSQAESQLDAQGRADGQIIVIPTAEVIPNPLIGGTTTYIGLVTASRNLKGSGDGTASHQTTAAITNNSTGQLIIEPDADGQAEVNSDIQHNDKDKIGIQVFKDESGVTQSINVDSQVYAVQYHNNHESMVYNRESVGLSEGTGFSSIIDGNTPTVGATLEYQGSGSETLEIKHRYKFDDFQVPPFLELHIQDLLYEGNEKFERSYTENVDLTGELDGEQPIWTGTAVRDVKGKIHYDNDNVSDWFTGHYDHRYADFNQSVQVVSTFDPVTQAITESRTVSGDEEVLVTGSWNDPGIFGVDSGTYDQSSRTDYERALEGIFDNWNGGEITPPSTDPEQPEPEPEPDPDPESPGTGTPPSSSSESVLDGVVRWIGGSRGDAGDSVINVMAGFADGLTFNATKLWRQAWGNDGVDYDSGMYTVGGVGSAIVSAPIGGGVAMGGLRLVKAAVNNFDDAGRCATLATKLWQGGCFVAGTQVAVSQLPYSPSRETELWSETDWLDDVVQFAEQPNSSPQATASLRTLGTHQLSIPIEQVPLGARIPTKNPKPWERDDAIPEPDQASWAKLSITMYRTDGGIVDAELIRPRTWIKSVGIEAGKLLPMNIEELQVKGSALVTAIDDCPEIADGEGSLVTARFCTREVHTVAQVEVLGTDGQIETITGTTIHPVWSEDKQDWVPLGELRPGEQLRGEQCAVTVLSVTIVNQAVPVYNIEVHGEHVYQVGELAALVHNSNPIDCAEALAKFPGSRLVTLPLRIPPGGKEFADPENIIRLGGVFKWSEFTPILVRLENGVPTIYEGMTRVELALRAGINQLPAFFIR